jgi:hypothetical protein
MTQLTDHIADELALLGPPLDRVPPDRNGYGVDLSCIVDLTPALDEVAPDSPNAVAEAVIRRPITPRGGVIDDLAYGYDLRAYCNRGVTLEQISRLQAQVRSEALKDERVASATVAITYVTRSNALRVHLRGMLKDSRESFALVFFVTADGIQLRESIDKHG